MLLNLASPAELIFHTQNTIIMILSAQRPCTLSTRKPMCLKSMLPLTEREMWKCVVMMERHEKMWKTTHLKGETVTFFLASYFKIPPH